MPGGTAGGTAGGIGGAVFIYTEEIIIFVRLENGPPKGFPEGSPKGQQNN